MAVVALFLLGVMSALLMGRGARNGAPPARVSIAAAGNGSSIRPVLAGGAIGVSGTVLGAMVTFVLGWFRDKRLYREETAMAVAELEQTIWLWGAAGGAGLRTALQTVTLRLRAAGVDDELRQALARVTAACWWDGENQHSRNQGEGIDANLLNLRRTIDKAVIGELLQLASQHSRAEWRQSALEHYRATPLTLPAEPTHY
ncbi:MAG: hypothetical protein M3256_01420 [Actinomycetota bacterium]|nr:hypothetical protein [Actinomycetota bacterium]